MASTMVRLWTSESRCKVNASDASMVPTAVLDALVTPCRASLLNHGWAWARRRSVVSVDTTRSRITSCPGSGSIVIRPERSTTSATGVRSAARMRPLILNPVEGSCPGSDERRKARLLSMCRRMWSNASWTVA